MLSEEAARVRGERGEGDDPALVLGEVLKYEVPGGFEEDVALTHPAVLWVLDRDKDGRFSDDDVHAFADMMGEYTKMWLREEVWDFGGDKWGGRGAGGAWGVERWGGGGRHRVVHGRICSFVLCFVVGLGVMMILNGAAAGDDDV